MQRPRRSSRQPAPKAPSGRQPAPPTARTGTDRFELGDELGRGGMAIVRVAQDRSLHRELAIKSLHRSDARAQERFIEEAQITGQLQHPNIVPVHELGYDAEGLPFLAMKRIVGQNFAQVIGAEHQARPKSCPVHRWSSLREMLEILVRVCDAMAFAHARGVIHRDLKPQNVMVGEFGEVLVVDWGLAKPIHARIDDRGSAVISDRRAARDHVTLEGSVTGTPAFMAPEQAGGFSAQQDEGVDIYALGGMLFAILTCVPPIEGGDASEQIRKVVEHKITSPGKRRPRWGIPPELDAICMKALARRRSDRYRSVSDMRDDIQAYLADRPVSVASYGIGQRMSRWVRHHPTATVVSALVAVFVALGAIGLWLWQSQVAVERDRVAAEREQRRAEEMARLQAERETLRQMAERAHWEDLARTLGATIQQRRDEAVIEFYGRLESLLRSGVHPSEAFQQISKTDGTRFIRAFDRLFEAHAKDPDLVPVTADDWFWRGALRHTFGTDLKAAIEDLDAALELDPGHTLALMRRANCYMDQARWRDALQDLDQVLELDPTMSAARGNRGFVLQQIGDLHGAIDEYTRMLQAERDDPGALINRGLSHSQLGHADLAIADFDRAVEVAPDMHAAWVERSREHMRRNRVRLAMADMERAAVLKPSDWEVTQMLALLRMRTDDREGAIAMLRLAWKHCDDERARRQLVGMFRELGLEPGE